MDSRFTCMIVDDEQDAVDYLSALIEEHCPRLKIAVTAIDSGSVRNKYFYHLPDLIFMDIQVDEKDGFEIYRDIYREKLHPHIIFVTAYNQYAIQAFRTNALDYLLKPVVADELKVAVKKFTDARDKEFQAEKIVAVMEGIRQKIKFNTREGFIFLDPGEIIYCEADANYTRIFTGPDKFMVVSHNLGQVEKRLPEKQFWRSFRSHLVNLKYLTQIDRVKKKCYLKYDTQVIKIPAMTDQIKLISGLYNEKAIS